MLCFLFFVFAFLGPGSKFSMPMQIRIRKMSIHKNVCIGEIHLGVYEIVLPDQQLTSKLNLRPCGALEIFKEDFPLDFSLRYRFQAAFCRCTHGTGPLSYLPCMATREIVLIRYLETTVKLLHKRRP